MQVKTSAGSEPSFGTGFVSDTDGNILGKKLDEEIIGPWVFVHIVFEDGTIKYRFYVLTKNEVKELIEDSNAWYWGELKHKAKNKQPVFCRYVGLREKGLNLVIIHLEVIQEIVGLV